jgi:hypothetical protein
MINDKAIFNFLENFDQPTGIGSFSRGKLGCGIAGFSLVGMINFKLIKSKYCIPTSDMNSTIQEKHSVVTIFRLLLQD